MEQKAKFVFEVSYEVCNKVGGIHTVISSKAQFMKDVYGDNYIAIGPYFEEKAKMEFDETKCPHAFLEEAIKEMKDAGIECKFGVWRVPGNPYAVLVDYRAVMDIKNAVKGKFWELYGIDSIRSGMDYDEPLMWSYACGILIEKMLEKMKHDEKKRVVVHLHEWLSGGTLFYLKMRDIDVPVVFTTHATMLGRTLAHHLHNFHEVVESGLKEGKVVDEKMAYKFWMEAKHQTERKCAELATVFTTVSDTMVEECMFILGRRPDLVLPNGLDMRSFPSIEMITYLHVMNKQKLLDFARGYFSPYYEIKTDGTRFIFISGRYEFRNKGIDIFIRALGKVNRMLKAEGCKTDYFALILVPSGVKAERQDVLENISLYRGIKDYMEEILERVEDRFMDVVTNRRKGDIASRIRNVLTEEERLKLRKLSLSFQSRTEDRAPLTPFVLNYEEKDDIILNELKKEGLLNRKEDKIKVVFYPSYLSITDRLLGMDYKSVVMGCSVGIFPSYYEPWGYTPLETAALGVVAITTDFAGFGRAVMKLEEVDKDGIIVLKRKGKSDEEVVEELASHIYTLLKSPKERIGVLKHHAVELSRHFDWNVLGWRYIEAHNLAIDKVSKEGT